MKKRNAEEGTYNGHPTYCPVNCQTEEDCPLRLQGAVPHRRSF